MQYNPFLKKFMDCVENENDDEWALMDSAYGLLACNCSNHRMPAVIDFRKIMVSPTHYSVRFGGWYVVQSVIVFRYCFFHIGTHRYSSCWWLVFA